LEKGGRKTSILEKSSISLSPFLILNKFFSVRVFRSSIRAAFREEEEDPKRFPS